MNCDFNVKRSWGPAPNYPNVLKYRASLNHSFIVIAGPCSIESKEQIDFMLPRLSERRIMFMRGGVYRAGTYPPDSPGLKLELLEYWHQQCKKHKMRNIVEVVDYRTLEKIVPHAHALQIGARQMQNYGLLQEVSQFEGYVAIKRNMGATLDEFLGAAEWLLRGRCIPILIERGSSTHMNHVRWDVSVSLIAAVKRITSMPIIVDASHGTGRRDLVRSVTLAGVAAGADGFLVEVHPDPEKSLTDSDQAMPFNELKRLKIQADLVRGIVNE